MSYFPIRKACHKGLNACAKRMTALKNLAYESPGVSEILNEFQESCRTIAKKLSNVMMIINEVYQRDEVGLDILLAKL